MNERMNGENGMTDGWIKTFSLMKDKYYLRTDKDKKYAILLLLLL
jgi:hypothetical protein